MDNKNIKTNTVLGNSISGSVNRVVYKKIKLTVQYLEFRVNDRSIYDTNRDLIMLPINTLILWGINL